MVQLPIFLQRKGRWMGSSKNAKSYAVAVFAPLFLGFVMPWILQFNRGIRSEAQFKFDPSIMLFSTFFEVVVTSVFVSVFVISLLYFAKQPKPRKILLVATAISLVSFATFCATYSLHIHGSLDGWVFYALAQMFPGLITIVGYAVAAIAWPCSAR